MSGGPAMAGLEGSREEQLHLVTRTHLSMRGGLGTETGPEWVLERVASEEIGNGKCRQL